MKRASESEVSVESLEEGRSLKLLVVDDDVTVVSALGRALKPLGQVLFATNGKDALRVARQSLPDLVLLDVEMPQMSGLRVCAELKGDPSLRHIPVIFITSHDSLDEEVEGLSLGAEDFISKPLRAPVVLARIRTQLKIKQMSDELRKLARTDEMTGLANRRELDEVLVREWVRATRTAGPLSLLMLDVDHFKAFNDHYGHPQGDDCLRSVANQLLGLIRRHTDLAARYGGEEFAVLLPDTSAAGAQTVSGRVLDELAAMRRPHAASPVASYVTVSIGVTTFEPSFEAGRVSLVRDSGSHESQGLIRIADKALYRAKALGRNRSSFLSFSDPSGETASRLHYPREVERGAVG